MNLKSLLSSSGFSILCHSRNNYHTLIIAISIVSISLHSLAPQTGSPYFGFWSSMVDQETTVPLPSFHQTAKTDCFSLYVLESLIFVKINQNSFSTRCKAHSRTLCNSWALNHARCRLNKTQECFPRQAVEMFNSLHSRIKEQRQSVFIKRVQGWLKSNILWSW